MDRGCEARRSAIGARGCALLLAPLGVALTFGLPASSATSAPVFLYPKSYETGGGSFSVAVGDVNRDGKPDLVAASNGVSVLMNKGDGSFLAKADYATGDSPYSVALGDVNGDGSLDIVTGNTSDDTASVLLNRGDGSFGAPVVYATGHDSGAIAVGDLNGDGKPDLASASNYYGSTVSVLLNRGDGSFQAPTLYGAGTGSLGVVIGDLDNDGKADLVTANMRVNTASVFLNTGNGGFQARHDYALGDDPRSVAIGDLNADGWADLAAGNEATDDVSVLLNRGDGGFRAKVDYPTAGRPQSVAIGDLDADGKPDLATASYYGGAYQTGSASLLLNRGGGRFRPKLDYIVGGQPESVVIADLNVDGKQDVAVAMAGHGVSVLLNTTGRCTVRSLVGRTRSSAKLAIVRNNCRLGKVRRVYSQIVKGGRVISQSPGPDTVLPKRSKVSLVVSRGRRY
jgi:large repetitive protein